MGSCPFWVRPIFVPMATPNCGTCFMSFRVTCYMFTILLTNYFLVFIFPFPHYVNWNSYLICNGAQFPCNFPFLMWLLLLMPHPLIGPFIFRVLVNLYQSVDSGQVLCAGLILPCRSLRLLPSCCIGWPSAYLVRWLPCLWITAWLRLVCVIKGVQCLLFFPGWPAWYWVWPRSMILLLFQHTFPPSSMWRLIICHRMGCFQRGTFSFRWLRQLFIFGAFQRCTHWHLLIPLNTSIITPWNLHYLWGTWSWMPSTIHGHFR